MEPTPRQELDRSVEELASAKARWVATGIPRRTLLLKRAIADTLEGAPEMVRDACRAKGLDSRGPGAAEDWLGGPLTTLRNFRLLVRSLREIGAGGRTELRKDAIRRRPDGQIAVEVFPVGAKEKILSAGFRAEVWMEPGVAEEDLPRTMARAYQPDFPRAGKVALVLGAGNVASIGPTDVLYKLFNENQVAVLKMNPVNDYLGLHVERGLAAFIEEGVLRVVYGGAAEGDHLVRHPGVDEIHITGSAAVHDAIVWGPPGPEQEAAKREHRPKTTKRVTSELGCVTPVLVVPGEWTERELAFQAENVATMVANNASFNCNAAKVLVTAQGWPQRKAFLEALAATLASLPARRAYYPGTDRKYDAFLAAHPEARPLAKRTEGVIPWTLIEGVDPSRPDDIVFNQEAWCGVLAETALPARDPGEYLEAAVEFANDRVWGTLSASVLVDPRTEARLGGRVDDAVARLRYGSVAVNHWSALAYGLVVTTWGAFPGHTLENVGSGIGFVHNTGMFERPQKSVVRGPFTVSPKPPWFATHRNAHHVARRIARFESDPAYWRVPAIALAALRG